jgi:hypothetical protein
MISIHLVEFSENFKEKGENGKLKLMTHLTSGWASNIARMSVVPDLGTPPINMSGIFR